MRSIEKTIVFLERFPRNIYNGNYIGRNETDEFRKRKGRRPIVRKTVKIAVASTFYEADFRLFLAIQLSCLELTSFHNVISNSMLFEQISQLSLSTSRQKSTDIRKLAMLI